MRFKYIVLLVLLSLFFLKPVFSENLYISHDGVAHIARFAAYFKAFSDGQIIPRWAGGLNSGYGSPLFIFFYPLPGYIASFIHIFGIGFETIYKLLVFLSFIIAPIVLFIWLKSKASEEIAFVTSVSYLVLPYRILDTLVRGDVAELLSFVFIPLVFIFIDRLQKDKGIINLSLGGLFFGLFILSHNAMAIIFAPIFLLYSFIFFNKDTFFHSLFIFLIGLLLSFFFWFPSILEGKFVYAKIFVEKLYKYNFIQITNLIYSNWGFGAEVNQPGAQSPQIGILYSIAPFLSLPFLKRLKPHKEIFFWIIIFFISAFMSTNLSSLFWDKLPLIKLMGYPWRFTALSGFASCMIIFYLLKNFQNKKILWVVVFFLLVETLPLIKVKGYEVKQNDSFYNSYQGTTDYHRRTSTIWTEGDFAKKADKQIEIIGGKAEIRNLKKKETVRSFDLLADTDTQILDNTVYFPGWKVKIDNNEVPIEFQDMNHRGLITFRASKGIHKVSIKFGETKDRFFADTVSYVAIFFTLGLLVLGLKRLK